MLRAIDRGLIRLYMVCGYLAAFCLAMICPMVLANIIGRWLGVFVPGTNEIAGYLMAAGGALGLAYAFGQGGHIKVTALIAAMKKSNRRIVDIVSLCISLAIIGYLSFYLIRMAFISFDFEDRSLGTDNMLLWIPQVPMVFGFVVFALSILHAIIVGIFTKGELRPALETL